MNTLWLLLVLAQPPVVVQAFRGELQVKAADTHQPTPPPTIRGDTAFYRLFLDQLHLQVPPGSPLWIRGSLSKVMIQGTSGPLTLSLDFSEIRVQDHQGPISLEGKASDLQIRGGKGAVHGRLDLGTVEIRNREGEVQIRGDFTEVRLDSVEGQTRLAINGTAYLNRLQGQLELKGRVWNGILRDVTGRLEALQEAGTLRVENFQGTGVFRTRYGVLVPAHTTIHVIREQGGDTP